VLLIGVLAAAGCGSSAPERPPPSEPAALPARPAERPTPCSEVSRSARHEIGDIEGDMARDTRCIRGR
jgi:hypothetical protein